MTCFLLRRTPAGDEVLVLRRSEAVRTYPGRWAAVSGYVEAGVSPRQQAYVEIEEETGLSRSEVRLAREGEELAVEDGALGVRWRVHVFLFEVVPDRLKCVPPIRLDWEHVESRWLRPEEVERLETVPGLANALALVYETRDTGHETREVGG